MKRIFQIVAVLLLCGACKAQSTQTNYHPIVLKAKETSLYAKEIDWITVNKRFKVLAENKESVEDLKPALQYLINSLGDKHAAFRSPKDYSIIVQYTGAITQTDTVSLSLDFFNTVVNDVSARFSYQLLDTGIGYLKIVGIGPGDVQKQADFIREGILALKEKQVNKWIVDLRFNGGGNMEPMFCGLAPLIGEGFVGGAINNNGEMRTYTIEAGNFINYGRLACEMETVPGIGADEKVAVLLSRYTISSGEMIAVAFKGRDQTQFIGEPTAGYTTGNGYDQISDDLAMVISQDVFMDRNKVVYREKVGVDVYSEFQHGVDLQEDNQIINAISWLNQ